MNNIKSVLDREPVSSEFIQSKQEFDKVLVGVKMSKPGIWKTSWFYGIVGTASIVFTVTVISLDSTSAANPSEVITSSNSEVVQPPEAPKTEAAISADEGISDSNSEDVRVEKPKIPEATTVNQSEQDLEKDTEVVTEISEPAQARINDHSGNSKMLLAHFGNVYRGKISVDDICGGTGLLCNNEWAVTSFTIQFYTGSGSIEQDIRGNQVPLNICEKFPKHGSFDLFITNIQAEHRSTGRKTSLNPVNFEATR